MKKIIQITSCSYTKYDEYEVVIYALCEDGTVWSKSPGSIYWRSVSMEYIDRNYKTPIALDE